MRARGLVLSSSSLSSPPCPFLSPVSLSSLSPPVQYKPSPPTVSLNQARGSCLAATRGPGQENISGRATQTNLSSPLSSLSPPHPTPPCDRIIGSDPISYPNSDCPQSIKGKTIIPPWRRGGAGTRWGRSSCQAGPTAKTRPSCCSTGTSPTWPRCDAVVSPHVRLFSKSPHTLTRPVSRPKGPGSFIATVVLRVVSGIIANEPGIMGQLFVDGPI